MKKQSEIYPYSCNQLSDKEARENLQNFFEEYGPTVVRIALLSSLGSLPAFAEGTPAPSSPGTTSSPAPGSCPSTEVSPALNNWSEGVGVAAVAVACASAVFPPTVLGIVGCAFVMGAQILRHMK